MTHPQLPFSEPDHPTGTPDMPDVDAIARHIGEHAPRVEYEDRTSKAAADQGWEPRNAQRHPSFQRRSNWSLRRVGPTGPVPGESEAEIRPAGHEDDPPLTPAERAVGKLAVSQLRRALAEGTEPHHNL